VAQTLRWRSALELVVYRAVNLAHVMFGPHVDQMFGLSLSDPVVPDRFVDAPVGLLTNGVYTDGPTHSRAPR
jgi:hypothetical protein